MDVSVPFLTGPTVLGGTWLLSMGLPFNLSWQMCSNGITLLATPPLFLAFLGSLFQAWNGFSKILMAFILGLPTMELYPIIIMAYREAWNLQSPAQLRELLQVNVGWTDYCCQYHAFP